MEVTVESVSTGQPLTHIGRMAGLCYGRMDEGDPVKRAINCTMMGHTGVLEHASVTFLVKGVSRACTHQLVRHRMASYLQESQRYVKQGMEDAESVILPPSFLGKIPEVKDLYYEAVEYCHEVYCKLVEAGVKPEDARYILPNCEATSIVVTMNLREFLHFFTERSSKHAQWEVKNLALNMLLELGNQGGEWAEYAGMVEDISNK